MTMEKEVTQRTASGTKKVRLTIAANSPFPNHTERLTGDRSAACRLRSKVPSRLMERSFNEAAATCLARAIPRTRRSQLCGAADRAREWSEGDDGESKTLLRTARIAAVLAAALGVAACANNAAQNAQANAAGMATPGSQQDFVVNVGDRVFFETKIHRI